MKRPEGFDEAIAELAPPAPPCFATRDTWVVFLQAQPAVKRGQTVLLIREGKPATFNRCLDFCEDCPPKFSLEMAAKHRCRPRWLLEEHPQGERF